ncbi:hepatocyte growth factor-like protein [Malaya genurostris]|uniref:hepatocyte growth factor-like protein n=1 Tax=Malaya genurostris TaxID=325434 RepID=UPI0026F3A33E|nr:hepatocyte growth factor-like protein [Malaya genurostris]
MSDRRTSRKMNHVQIVFGVLRALVVLQWLPCLTAYHLPRSSVAGVQTLGNLMSVPALPPHHRGPMNAMQPPSFLVPPRPDNFSDLPVDDRVDRSYQKKRKIIYKYPVRHGGGPKPRIQVKYPTLHPKYYTAYTEWTRCDVYCKQRRERFCIARSKCGLHIHVEERKCHRRLCSPLSIPTAYSRYEHIPLSKYSVVGEDSYKPKKKKRIIVADDYEDEDYYDDYDDDDTEYVIIKKKSKRKWKRPTIIYQRRKEIGSLDNHQPQQAEREEDFDRFSEQRVQPKHKPVDIVLEDFDDRKIFSPSPHYDQQFSTAQSFRRRPYTAVVKRKPSRLTEYFEDNYDNLYRDGTGFTNRREEMFDSDGFHPISERLQEAVDDEESTSGNQTSSEAEFNRLMESFPSVETTTEGKDSHHTKRDVSNFLDDYGEDDDSDSSEEDFSNSTAEVGTDGKKYPGKSLLKLGVVTQKKAREKAVFEMPRKVDNPYSKWSRWSKCTAKCTTRRYKRCKVPSVCGNDVIREVAYCYTEGSFCEEWIGNQLYQNPTKSPPATTVATTTTKPTKLPRNQLLIPHHQSARSRSDVQDNSISQQSFGSRRGLLQPEYMPQEMTCGISITRNKPKKYLYNMLRIIGGKASRRGQWPWQVAILNRFKEAFCGGTLVAPRWILTAAHCVRKRLYVRLGEHNLQQSDGTEMEFRVDSSIKHPRYDKKTVDNDVALLRLPRDVERSNFVGYACLPERYQTLPTGHTCTIIGWGKKRHNDDAGTDVLHEAEVPIITNDKCRAVYHDYTITKNMFCAGHKRGRIDTCAGDSGGPLLCRDTTKVNSPWTIFGITSFGDGCGKKNKFGIYTKLPNYVDWVWSVINCDGNCRT